MRAFVMRRSYSLSSHECYEFSHKSSCFCTVRYWVFRFQTVCVIDKNVLDWYCYFNIKYLYLISTYLYCYLGYLYLNIAKKYLLRCNNKTFLCRVVNRYTEIRKSGYRFLAQISGYGNTHTIIENRVQTVRVCAACLDTVERVVSWYSETWFDA